MEKKNPEIKKPEAIVATEQRKDLENTAKTPAESSSPERRPGGESQPPSTVPNPPANIPMPVASNDHVGSLETFSDSLSGAKSPNSSAQNASPQNRKNIKVVQRE